MAMPHGSYLDSGPIRKDNEKKGKGSGSRGRKDKGRERERGHLPKVVTSA